MRSPYHHRDCIFFGLDFVVFVVFKKELLFDQYYVSFPRANHKEFEDKKRQWSRKLRSSRYMGLIMFPMKTKMRIFLLGFLEGESKSFARLLLFGIIQGHGKSLGA